MTTDIKHIITELTGLEYKYNTNTFQGADILEPKGEVFKDVYVLDFKSFYPSIIVEYDIFGKKMSEWLIQMFKQRNTNPEAKLTMNSVYGQMKHFDINKAAKVTEIGRNWINSFRSYLEELGYYIIYSHTDSVMICDITQDKVYKLHSDIEKYLYQMRFQSGFKNPILNICIEDTFKFIFFKSNGSGFAKNTYIGVTYDDKWVTKGNWTPSLEELSMIEFVKYKLSEGSLEVTSDELIEYIDTYKPYGMINEKFINYENFNIIRIKPQVVNLS